MGSGRLSVMRLVERKFSPTSTGRASSQATPGVDSWTLGMTRRIRQPQHFGQLQHNYAAPAPDRIAMMMESVMVSIGCKKQQGFSQIEHSKASASYSTARLRPAQALTKQCQGMRRL